LREHHRNIGHRSPLDAKKKKTLIIQDHESIIPQTTSKLFFYIISVPACDLQGRVFWPWQPLRLPKGFYTYFVSPATYMMDELK